MCLNSYKQNIHQRLILFMSLQRQLIKLCAVTIIGFRKKKIGKLEFTFILNCQINDNYRLLQ